MMRSSLNCIVIVVAAALLPGAMPGALAQIESPAYGILVMAHGGNEHWNEQIRVAVESTGADVPVEIAFGMADRATLQASIQALESQGVRYIAVVRLFVSGESFLQQTRYLLGVDDAVPPFIFDSSRGGGMRPVADPRSVLPVVHSSEIAILEEGLVDTDFVGKILAERALHLSSAPERETVLVVAHGMAGEESNQRLIDALEARSSTIRRAAPFRSVSVVALREDWDEARLLAENKIRDIVRQGATDGAVIVVPMRVVGFGPYAEVLQGLRYSSDGRGLLPHDDIGAWIMRSSRRLACVNGWTEC